MSEKFEKLFKDFEFKEEKKALFLKLRKTVPKEVNDSLLATYVCSKKTYEKVEAACKKVKPLIDSTGFGNIKLKQEGFQLFLMGSFIFDPSLRSKNGEHYLISNGARALKSIYSRDRKKELFLHMFQTILLNYPDVSTKGLVVVVHMEDIGIRDFDIRLGREFHKMIKLLPFRPKKIIVCNPPWFMKLILTILRPFMSKKIFGRILMINFSDLGKHVDEKVILPLLKSTISDNMKEDSAVAKLVLEVFCEGDKKLFDSYFKKKKVEIVDVMKEKGEKKELDEKEKEKITEEFLKKMKEEDEKEKK